MRNIIYSIFLLSLILSSGCITNTSANTDSINTSIINITTTPTSFRGLINSRYYETNGIISFSYIPPKDWQRDIGEIPLTRWVGPCNNLDCILTFSYLGKGKSAKEAEEYWREIMFSGVDYDIGLQGRCNLSITYECYLDHTDWTMKLNEFAETRIFSANYYIVINENILLITFKGQKGFFDQFDIVTKSLNTLK
jgi:hypothetical protein